MLQRLLRRTERMTDVTLRLHDNTNEDTTSPRFMDFARAIIVERARHMRFELLTMTASSIVALTLVLQT